MWLLTNGAYRLAEAVSDMLLGMGDMAFLFPVGLLCVGPPVPPRAPSRGSFTMRHWRRRLPRAAIGVTGVTFFVGAILNAYALSERGPHSSAAVWDYCLLVGAFLGLGRAVIHWTKSTVTVDDITSARSSIRGDRRITLLHSIHAALSMGLLATTVELFVFTTGALGMSTIVDEGLLARGVSIALFGAVLALAAAAWPHYTIARLLLAARGHTPWRLQAFLEDAHRLGVLRQTGPAHQFRHALLQQHLTATPELPARSPSPPTPAHLPQTLACPDCHAEAGPREVGTPDSSPDSSPWAWPGLRPIAAAGRPTGIRRNEAAGTEPTLVLPSVKLAATERHGVHVGFRSSIAGYRKVIFGAVRLRPASGRGHAAGKSRRRDGSAPC